jgi:hypothetical protein
VVLFSPDLRADLRTQAIDKLWDEGKLALDYSSVHITLHRRLKKGKVRGWAPRLRAKVFGKNRNGDTMIAVLKKGRRKIAQVQCKMPVIVKGFKWEKLSCKFGSTVMVKKPGKFSIQLVYKTMLPSMETKKIKFAKLKFKVLRYNLHPNTGKMFIVNRDFQVGEAYIGFHRSGWSPHAAIYYTIKHKGDKTRTRPDRPKQFLGRCFLNGKMVGWKDSPKLKLEQSTTYHPWRGRRQAPGEIGWQRAVFIVRGVFPKRTRTRYSETPHYLNEHPGNYVCKVMYDGNVIREFSFKVKKPTGSDQDPIIVPHPDQSKVFTGKKHLISVKIRKGWRYEKHVPSRALKRGFWGTVRRSKK